MVNYDFQPYAEINLIPALKLIDEVLKERDNAFKDDRACSEYLYTVKTVSINKIMLIKAVREVSRLNLKDSKELVEFFLERGYV